MKDVTYQPILISDNGPVSIDLDFGDLVLGEEIGIFIPLY